MNMGGGTGPRGSRIFYGPGGIVGYWFPYPTGRVPGAPQPTPPPGREQIIEKGMIIGRCWRPGCWKALFWPWHRCKKKAT